MKTYALPQTKELLSIVTDDGGNPRLDTLCPRGQYLAADPAAPWNTPDPIKPEDQPVNYPGTPVIVTDENGNLSISTLATHGQYLATDPTPAWDQPVSRDPADYPGLLWTPPLIVELVKILKPDPIPGKIAEPILVWTDISCTRDWEIRDMTPAELAESLRKVWPSAIQFLGQFTMPELGGIGVSIDPVIAAMRLILSSWIGPIYSDDPRVVVGLAAIEAAGIISAERRAQIVPAPAPVFSGALATGAVAPGGTLTLGAAWPIK